MITNGHSFEIAQKISLSTLDHNSKKEMFNDLISGKTVDPKKIKLIEYSKKEKIDEIVITDFLNKINVNKKIDSNSPIFYEITFNFNSNNITYKILPDSTFKIKKNSFIFGINSKDDLRDLFETEKQFDKNSLLEIFEDFKNLCKELNINKEQISFKISGIHVNNLSTISPITINELDNILKNGNLFVDNTLVVNFNGDVKLLSHENNNFEISLYPIQINQFPSHENCVGQFYNEKNMLDHIYKEYLNYYYEFIKTKKKVTYVDLYEETDFILNKIKKR